MVLKNAVRLFKEKYEKEPWYSFASSVRPLSGRAYILVELKHKCNDLPLNCGGYVVVPRLAFPTVSRKVADTVPTPDMEKLRQQQELYASMWSG